ncbi:putative uroporphyrin-III c-methyltransferase [Candidatus Hodgkinia cicadicola]|nr:putative uroporphyrin-III c-methyltransferase [Candidatus Hodgkinia cicadicola]
MLSILGSGPGAVHHINLCVFAALESCDVVLMETLVNRSLLELLNPECKLKYVGRPVHGACNSLYGILLSLLWISGNWVTLGWIKNGDALLFNRGWSANVFLNAFSTDYFVASGSTSALVALSSACVSATSKFASGVVISLGLRCCCKRTLTTHTTVVYMTRLNALILFDSLVCGGLTSNKIVALVCGLSLLTQVGVCASLRRFVFCSEMLRSNSPSLLIVGNCVCYHVNTNWLKFTKNVGNVRD